MGHRFHWKSSSLNKAEFCMPQLVAWELVESTLLVVGIITCQW